MAGESFEISLAEVLLGLIAHVSQALPVLDADTCKAEIFLVPQCQCQATCTTVAACHQLTVLDAFRELRNQAAIV